MEDKKKSNVGLIVIVVILLLVCAGMGTFIFINKDKMMSKESTTVSNNEKKEATERTIKEEENNTNTENKDNNTIETRSCLGTYSGQGAVTQDARTGQNENGTITIELKDDSTYKLTKSGMDQYWAGHYTIIENALLLKEGPSTCGPGADCSEKYSSFLNIADDCSKITGGYGSVFFDSNFTLTKTN